MNSYLCLISIKVEILLKRIHNEHNHFQKDLDLGNKLHDP